MSSIEKPQNIGSCDEKERTAMYVHVCVGVCIILYTLIHELKTSY